MKRHPRTTSDGSDPRTLADAFVRDWIVDDYEPDDVDMSFMSERSIERLVDRVAELIESSQRAATRSAAATQPAAAGNPLEVSKEVDLSDVSDYRLLNCPAYQSCLDFSVSKKWRGFACGACDGPGKTKTARGGKHA